jgi:hypothetical protein
VITSVTGAIGKTSGPDVGPSRSNHGNKET